MWIVEHDSCISQFQGIVVMVDEDLAKAAVSMQFKHCNQMFFRELLAQRLHTSVYFVRCMGKVA